MIDDRELVTLALRRRVAAARQRMLPSSHSTVEEIVAYYEGEMPEEQGWEFKRHFVLCRDCPDLLLDLDGFVHLPATKEGDPPPGMESVWRRLCRQLAAEARARARRPVHARWWRTRIPLLAAALILLCPPGSTSCASFRGRPESWRSGGSVSAIADPLHLIPSICAPAELQ